jgi:hypothetical protein
MNRYRVEHRNAAENIEFQAKSDYAAINVAQSRALAYGPIVRLVEVWTSRDGREMTLEVLMNRPRHTLATHVRDYPGCSDPDCEFHHPEILLPPTPADYLRAVTDKIETLPVGALNRYCPECGREAELDGEHITIATVGGFTVAVIGCDGYWCIDPKLVGIHAPNWSPAEEAQ